MAAHSIAALLLSRRPGLAPAALADEGHEDDGAVGPLLPVVGAAARDDDQVLLVARPHRDHESGAVRELLAKRMGDRRGSRSDDDAVPRRAVGITLAAVANAHVDALDAQLAQRGARTLGEVGEPLDRGHPRAEPRQHGRLVARPGADLEDPVAGLD